MMKVNPVTRDVTTSDNVSFNTKQESEFGSTDLRTMYARATTKIYKETFSTYIRNGSGWTLKNVVGLYIMVNRLKPIRGSFRIPLTKGLSRSKGLINMKNKDQQCFKWAVTRALNPVHKNPQRVTGILDKQAERRNWDGIRFPTPCTESMFRKYVETNNNISLHESACTFQLNNVRRLFVYSSQRKLMRVISV